MAFTKETKWFCEHASTLEKYSGKWIAFSVKKNIFSEGETLETAMKKLQARHTEKPFVFHVPSKDELQLPPRSPSKS